MDEPAPVPAVKVPIEETPPFRLRIVKGLPFDLGEVNAAGGGAAIAGSLAAVVFFVLMFDGIPFWVSLLDGIPGIGGLIMLHAAAKGRPAGGSAGRSKASLSRQRVWFNRCTFGSYIAAAHAVFLVLVVIGVWLAPGLRSQTRHVAVVAGGLAMLDAPAFAAAAFNILAQLRLRRREL